MLGIGQGVQKMFYSLIMGAPSPFTITCISCLFVLVMSWISLCVTSALKVSKEVSILALMKPVIEMLPGETERNAPVVDVSHMCHREDVPPREFCTAHLEDWVNGVVARSISSVLNAGRPDLFLAHVKSEVDNADISGVHSTEKTDMCRMNLLAVLHDHMQVWKYHDILTSQWHSGMSPQQVSDCVHFVVRNASYKK